MRSCVVALVRVNLFEMYGVNYRSWMWPMCWALMTWLTLSVHSALLVISSKPLLSLTVPQCVGSSCRSTCGWRCLRRAYSTATLQSESTCMVKWAVGRRDLERCWWRVIGWQLYTMSRQSRQRCSWGFQSMQKTCWKMAICADSFSDVTSAIVALKACSTSSDFALATKVWQWTAPVRTSSDARLVQLYVEYALICGHNGLGSEFVWCVERGGRVEF